MISGLRLPKWFQYHTTPKIDHVTKSVVKVEAHGGGSRTCTRSIAAKTARHKNVRGAVALLYHYRTLSKREWRYKSCDRGGVKLKQRQCGDAPPVGTVFEDTAWRTLICNLPKYRTYDDYGFQDYS